MSYEFPPMWTSAEDSKSWTLGDLYQYVQHVLWSAENEDRQIGLAPVLEEVSITLASSPWRIESRSRGAKIVFLTEVNNLLAGRAPWTHALTYGLWQSVAYSAPTSQDIATDAIRRLPESSREVGAALSKSAGAFWNETGGQVIPKPGTLARDGLFAGAGALALLYFGARTGLIKRS